MKLRTAEKIGIAIFLAAVSWAVFLLALNGALFLLRLFT